MKIIQVSQRGLLSLVLWSSVSCGDEDKRPAQAGVCSAEQIESDLEAEPLIGPAVETKTGKLVLAPGTQYIVSSTYGQPLPGSDGAPVSARYAAVFGAVAEQLQKEPGLLAATVASSERCGSGRTLAVWKSEEDMYSFVASDAHTTAMIEVKTLLRPTYRVTHWSASTAEQVSFEQAGLQLAAKQ